MTVGIVGPTDQDSFADNVHSALTAMGVRSHLLGPAHLSAGHLGVDAALSLGQRAFPTVDRLVQRGIVDRARRFGCSLVISVDARLAPETVTLLKRQGMRTCLWFPDAITNVGRFAALMAPYDGLFYKEPWLVDRIRDMLGLPIHYLPEACNPIWHRPPEEAGHEPYVVVAGHMYPSRVLLLRRMVEAGIPLRIYGPPFPRWLDDPLVRPCHTGRFIAREEKAAVFRSAAAVLNNLHPGEVHGVNARLFEAAGCGAAVLTEWRPALPDLFVEGKEVQSFRDFDELVAKARLLLDDLELGNRMGAEASRRAHREHSYARRLEKIFAVLECDSLPS